ncbi:MAG: MaoC family dehydratase, partial [Parcubacteria group bacterium]|nr:MaoC family dehydratase [Parcubacteria group bacterium]
MSRKLKWSDVKIGDLSSFEKKIIPSDLKKFAALTGDRNLVHLNLAQARRLGFKKPIAHGMLLGSFFSALIGNFCPGEKHLYLKQKLFFRSPVYVGETISVCGRIIAKSDSVKIITMQTLIKRKGRIVVSG